MASIINADTSDGLKLTSDTSGEIQFQSGGTTKMTVSSSGVSGIPLGTKNRIINGNMTIDQRNAGASVTNISGGVFSSDRFNCYGTQATKYTVQQNAGAVTPPEGFTNYLGATSSSAYSVLVGDWFAIRQICEGYNVADLGWGTADAKTVTLSFWVRSSLTGTFGASIYNGIGNRSYPFTYTISVANTWEKKTVTIAGDTTGTWATTNGGSLTVNFSLGSGTTVSGTAGAWAGAFYTSATGATSVVGTSGATFYITGVQLEVGTTATDFENLQYGQQLALCQRYYYKMSGASNYLRFATGFVGAGSTTTAYCYFHPPVTMRDKPTSIDWSASIGLWNGGAISAISALAIEASAASTTSVNLQVTSTGLTQYTPMFIMGNNSSTASIAVSAEL